MKLSFFFANRYLFSKKSTQAINIISIISVVGVCVGAAALFIILSVFNGFEELNLLYYQKLSPDLKVMKVDESHFHLNEIQTVCNELDTNKYIGVGVLEDQALLKYGSSPYYTIVKGVSPSFLKIKELDSVLIAGGFFFKDSLADYAVIGNGITIELGIDIKQTIQHIDIFAPKSNISTNTLDPSSAIHQKVFYPSGIFSVQQNLDERYIFTSLPFAQDLFEKSDSVNGYEIYGCTEKEMLLIQKEWKEKLPKGFVIKNRYELNETLYKVLNTERWAVYLILTLILIVAICNIIGAVTMLIIDKKKDIALLRAMGMDNNTIRRIYFIQSLLISFIGVIIGLFLGSIFVFLQKKYGLISIGGSEEFMIQKYPVKFIFSDLFLVFFTVMIISVITGWLTSAQSKNASESIKDSIS
jgi:lipoprotein-releasing system permease protein